MSEKEYCMGEEIYVDTLVKFKCNESKQRAIYFQRMTAPKKAYYVGYTYKFEGELTEVKYNENTKIMGRLVPKKSYRVARIRFNPQGKEYHVLFDHISKEL